MHVNLHSFLPYVILGRLAFLTLSSLLLLYVYSICVFIHILLHACAGQWKMVLFRSAGAHAVRLGALPPGQAPRPHLTAATSVRAPPSQVTLTFASDLCPVTGRSSQEVRHHNQQSSNV